MKTSGDYNGILEINNRDISPAAIKFDKPVISPLTALKYNKPVPIITPDKDSYIQESIRTRSAFK